MLTEQRSPLLGDFQAAGFPFSIQAPRTLRPGASGALLVLGGLLGVVSLVLGGIGGIGSLLLGGIGRIPGLFGGVGGGVLGLGGGIGSGILQIAGLLGGSLLKSRAFSARRPSGRPPYRPNSLGAVLERLLDVLARLLHLIDETHGESPFIGSCACIHHTVPQPSPPRDEPIRR